MVLEDNKMVIRNVLVLPLNRLAARARRINAASLSSNSLLLNLQPFPIFSSKKPKTLLILVSIYELQYLLSELRLIVDDYV